MRKSEDKIDPFLVSVRFPGGSSEQIVNRVFAPGKAWSRMEIRLFLSMTLSLVY